MKKFTLWFFVITFLLMNSVLPQTDRGTSSRDVEPNESVIRGKIYDGTTSDPLPDAVIKIVELKIGTASDIDGSYELKGLKPGNYSLRATYVGYKPNLVNVSVGKEETKTVDLILEPESSSIDTITVRADLTTGSDAGILLKQQKSEGIIDGISSQHIKRTPDVTSSDVLKRISGISVVQDKFVYVRGTGERYNNTLLNGSYLPSTEPDKKAFSFDLFPSALLDNLTIAKSNTPDKPGDFTGGLVQMSTIDFPEKFTYSLSVNSSFTSNTTGEKVSTYNAGQKKILFINSGIDDGNRLLPSNFPSEQISPDAFSPEEIQAFGREFRNNWLQSSRTAPPNGGFQLSFGQNINLLHNPLGIIAAYSYKNSFSNKSIEKTELNEFSTDSDTISSYRGNASEYSVIWGGVLNINYKIGTNHKISSKNTYTLASEDETQQLQGFYTGQLLERRLYATKFIQRNLLSMQISGESHFPSLLRTTVNWQVNYNESKRIEPDSKRMTYQRDMDTEDPFYAPIPRGSTTGNEMVGGRFFANLKDINRGLGLDVSQIFPPLNGLRGMTLKLKLGILTNTTTRNFSVRSFAPVLSLYAPFTLQYQGIDSIFRAENISPDRISYYEITSKNDAYNASQNLYAGYLMFDASYWKLRLVAGARLEHSHQRLNSFSLLGEAVNKSLLNNDVLPSVNLTYQLTERINIRAAYSQAVSRPEFREIAPFGYVDFGTLTYTTGNPDSLNRTLIRNYDMRFEFFPAAGEILSASFFYKKFDSPIEEAFLPRSGDEKLKSYFNARNGAVNYGVELELRKRLGIIHKLLDDFTIAGNIAFIYSRVNLEGLTTTATKKQRRLQGQSPYTINFGLFYDNLSFGTSINVLYNKIGDRIAEVGLGGFNDIMEKGRDVLDISASQRLPFNLELKFSVKDILNQDYLFTQEVNGTEKIVRRYTGGINYSLGISYKY